MLAFTYHPSSDPYHCAFRALRLLEYSQGQSYKDKIFRILDFYLLFPFTLKDVRKTRSARSSFGKLRLGRLPEPYQKLPGSRRLFRQLETVQGTAYRHLAAANVLDLDAYRDSQITRGNQELSAELKTEIERVNSSEAPIMSFLFEDIATIPLYGPDGLKARTGLMEFRYDPS